MFSGKAGSAPPTPRKNWPVRLCELLTSYVVDCAHGSALAVKLGRTVDKLWSGLTADQNSEAMHTSDAAEAELLSIVSKSHEI